jgi:glutathione S-transferase
MKLYDFVGAPNPRRVRIFAAEKGLAIESVYVELGKGEHKSPEFLLKNPSGKIPVLELDDGTCIAESIAISRYLESLQPEPNLFGHDARETALIEMRHRHIELELLGQISVSWVNGPIVAKLGLVEPIEAAKARSDWMVNTFYDRLNGELGQRSFVSGDRFAIADITALVAIDFASAMVDLKPDAGLSNLWRWHEEVSARPSSTA